MATAPQPLTLEEFLKLPEQKPALEFFGGMVTQKVSPKGPHGWLQSTLTVLLNTNTSDGPRHRAWAFTETRASFRQPSGDVSLVPDVAVYLWERIPRTPRGRVADDFFVLPDIAIEILSPGQSLKSQAARCRWFIEHGSSIALLVNPRNESIVDFRPDRPERTLRGGERLELSPVLPGFELSVRELFDSLYA